MRLYPDMTKEDFLNAHEGSLIKEDCEVVKCTCGDYYCTGWKFVPKDVLIAESESRNNELRYNETKNF